MNPKAFSARRLVVSVTIACCATVALMGSASATETPDGYITDSLVGQSNAAEEDRTTDGWLHSVVGESARDAQVASHLAQRKAAAGPFIRDALIGQVPEAPPVSAVTGDRVLPDESSDLGDEIALTGALLLAFLMGIALTLSVEHYTHRTA
jgi:hypothetical protein